MKITHYGSSEWQGSLREGEGSISTESGALAKQPFSLVTRYGEVPGVNPEELLGAAHAGCFTMSLVRGLGLQGYEPTHIASESEVTLEQDKDGFTITHVHLTLEARIPGIDAATFQAIAERAKAFCPLSKVIRAEISFDAALMP